MKKSIFMLLIVLFLLQFSFLPMIFSDITVNLVLLLVIALSIVYPFEKNIGWVILGAVLLDWFSVTGFGLYLLAMIIIAFLVDFVRKDFLPERKGVIIPLMVVVSAKIVFDVLLGLLNWIFEYYKLSHWYGWAFSAGGYLYLKELVVMTLAGLVIYRIVEKMERSIGQGRMDLRLTNN